MSETKSNLEEQFKEFFKSHLNLGGGNVALNLLSNLDLDKLPNLETLTGILDKNSIKNSIKNVEIGGIIDLLDTFLPKVEVEMPSEEVEPTYDDITHITLVMGYGKGFGDAYKAGLLTPDDIEKLLSNLEEKASQSTEDFESYRDENLQETIKDVVAKLTEENKIPNVSGVYGQFGDTDLYPNPYIDFSSIEESPKLKTLSELNDCVIGWAEDRNIFEQGTTIDQARKTSEELDETRDALARLDELESSPHSDLHEDRIEELKLEVKDGIGDQLVTLYLKAKMAGFTLEECGNHSWNEIKDRKGKMVDGQFVKEV